MNLKIVVDGYMREIVHFVNSVGRKFLRWSTKEKEHLINI